MYAVEYYHVCLVWPCKFMVFIFVGNHGSSGWLKSKSEKGYAKDSQSI